ncbi:glycoside hydrolase family 37 protein [Phanerochaete sordida]|uniref:Trehalase n=1 Tax=Phanerochaete sordida TaxID=48140 RepID=A0A9P3LET8_9APHY|nr:glycoside hydrolase family 37 protein [Phanerochaete sordida]
MKSMRAEVAAVALCLAHGVRGVPQAQVSTGVPSITLSTATPAPTAPLTNTLPSQVPLPPKQAWCPSEIFCAGELLQTVNLAQPYSDQKTIVDKPTSKSSQQVLSDFNALFNASTTEGSIVTFLDNDFRGEGLELEAVALPQFNTNPAFLNNVTDPLLKAWSQTVHGYWTQLARSTNDTTLCPEGTESGSCESSLIPLNHTFVIPGGRFREQYYWDSYWIVRGLLKSELFAVANDTLQNFMDELDHFGFIPNGGRIYYLNRSQPPLFIRMLFEYVSTTNDTSMLSRALPLAEKELAWWTTNRTVTVTSPFTNQTYPMARYAVVNTAPRPESYLTDYLTANDPMLTTPLTDDERAELYSELASGAESGWDYSTRFVKEPLAGGSNNTNPALRSYNIKNNIPVDLNSILYASHGFLAQLYDSQGNSSAASSHRSTASTIRAGILDLFWDPTKLAFYDFNQTSNARNDIFTTATFYPLWNGIVPDELLSSTQNAFGFFSVVNMVLNRYNGTVPVTFVESGLQWDAPNAWPPHQHIILEALKALPANVSSTALPKPSGNQSTFDLIPSGQLVIPEAQLPGQLIIGASNATKSGPGADLNTLNGTVVNGGNATAGEGWAQTLQRELANRYFASAFCSWHATGGSIPNILPRLSDQELNVTQSVNNTGNMFEKFSISDIDSAGRGGEYTVQAGFGWTNGVVLILASEYGSVLTAPQCPDLLAQAASTTATTTGSNGAIRGAPSVAALVLSALLAVMHLL